jgi:alpha-glucosidase (family GH31 glycosyl hydrolase)
MPLLGGGGAGNVAGSNPTGTGNTLQYVGNNIWAAWSGLVDPTNTTKEALSFKSPNVPLIIDMVWTVNFTELTANRDVLLQVKLNGELIMHHEGQQTSAGDFSVSFPAVLGPYVIPADSEVVVILGTSEDAAVDQYVTLTGRMI